MSTSSASLQASSADSLRPPSLRRGSGSSTGSVRTPKARQPELPSVHTTMRTANGSSAAQRLPGSGQASGATTEDETDNEAPMSTTTITTHTIDSSGSRKSSAHKTVQVTHVGATSVEHTLRKDGTIKLHPISDAKGIKKVKVKRVVTFEPRWSKFDRQNLAAHTDPFRGFYVLFWIMLGMGAIKTFFVAYRETGSIPGLSFGSFISRNGTEVALSDGVLIATTFLCVPFIKLVKNGWIGPKAALAIQHLGQAAFVGTAVRWVFYRSWPWVQSGYIVLHAIAMLMKIHSYTAYNMELGAKSRKFKRTVEKLRKALANGAEKGTNGLEGALAAAGKARDRKEAEERAAEAAKAQENGHGPGEQSESDTDGGTDTPATVASDSSDPSLDPANATHGHRRTTSLSSSSIEGKPDFRPRAMSGAPNRDPAATNRARSNTATTKIAQSLIDRTPSLDDDLERRDTLATLAHHPDNDIATLAAQAQDLDEDLTSTGPAEVRWPRNVTYKNFWDYLLVPTLVYELEYPRTNRIRPLYVVEKTLATFGTLSLLLVCTEHYILPHTPKPGDPIIESFFNLCVPFMINYLLIFYIIFECICNAFAELTCFADREFYSDWWNSTSFDEFSRRWNKPVHMFLLRHVYATTLSTLRISKFQASFVTFLLSACFHELVMVVVTKKIRPYLFLMQMAQLPLIMIGRHPFFRKNPTLGNMAFWIGLMTGFPLLAVSYLTM